MKAFTGLKGDIQFIESVILFGNKPISSLNGKKIASFST